MLPTAYQDDLTQDFTVEENKPSRTFRLDHTWQVVRGTIDQIEAMEQAIYLILNVERYEWPIYSWDYGVELMDLIGQHPDYCKVEIQRRDSEALLQDDRITEVKDFHFTITGKKILAEFTVVTIFGETRTEVEVNI